MKNPLTHAQKSVVRNDLTRAIGQICDSWPDAMAAEQSRGYPNGSGNGSGGIGSHGDPTANSLQITKGGAIKADKATRWLGDVRGTLALMFKQSAATGMSWVGPFDPPRMRSALIDAGIELVELWPKNVMRLFHRLYDLANEGKREWPPTPRKGDNIDGIVVGQKSITIEMCAGCGEQVFGGAADPIVRIDGKPYHKTTCYWREKRKLVPA